jgi:predicted DNA-binding protein (MmcQ/YjbR family)
LDSGRAARGADVPPSLRRDQPEIVQTGTATCAWLTHEPGRDAIGAACDDPGVDAAELRRTCLGFPGAWEDFPFTHEHSVFKVERKMFALSALAREPLEVSLKCDPDLAVQLRASYPCVRPGYHLNKRHWNTVTLDGSIADGLVCDMIEDSYDLVVSAMPQRVRNRLGWAPG